MKKAAFPVIIITFLFLALSLALFAGKTSPGKETAGQPNEDNKQQAKFVESSQSARKKQGAKVYFPSGSFLKAEFHQGQFKPIEVLTLLLKGPTTKGHTSYIPHKTRLISLKVLKGRAIVNLSKEILNAQNVGAETEELTIYSITDTLTEFSSIKEVLLQVEGKSEGEIDGYLVEDFWGHVGLYDQPFKRNESLIKD